MPAIALFIAGPLIGLVSVSRLSQDQDRDRPPPVREDPVESSDFTTLLELAREVDRAALEESRETERFRAEMQALDDRIALTRERLAEADERLQAQTARVEESRETRRELVELSESSAATSRAIAVSLLTLADWLADWARPRIDSGREASFFSRLEESRVLLDASSPDLGVIWREVKTASSELLAIGSRCERGVLDFGEESSSVVGDAVVVGSVYALIVTPDRRRGVLRDFLGRDVELDTEGIEAAGRALDVMARVRSAIRANLPLPMSVFREPSAPVSLEEAPR